MNLIDILKEIITQEASLAGDMGRITKVQNYVDYANQQIDNYSNNNHVIKVYNKGVRKFVAIKIKDLLILFTNFPKYSSDPFNPVEYEADFDKVKETINVYKAQIKIKPKLKVDFDESFLKHELIHYFDMSKLDVSKIKAPSAKISTGQNYGKYINNPFETNAHFFQIVIPEVLKYIKNKDKLPKTFDEFKKILLNGKEAKEFLSNLDDKNRKKFLKRIGEYWTSVISNDDLDLEKPDYTVDNRELEKKTYSWISKIKDKVLTENKKNRYL